MEVKNPNAHQKRWLDLSIGQNLLETCSQSRLTSMKVYACNFCKRKFYSSQALGGHQNAHRRERDTMRRYQAPTMMNLPTSSTVKRSLVVQAHSSVHAPIRDGETTVARFIERHGFIWMQQDAGEEAVDLKWPGGFYLDPQPASHPSNPHTLDLNLKL